MRALTRDPPASAQGAAVRLEDPVDVGWPREFTAGGTTLTVYQPQPEKWEDGKLEARAVVSVKEAAAEEQTYGVVTLGRRR